MQIPRDEHGIPHLSADSEPAVYRALGQCHATDRGLGMLLPRILGQGRACELLRDDDAMLDVDRYFRRLNLARDPSAELARLTSAETACVEAYCEGASQVFARQTPWELKLLGYRAQPWTPADVVLMLRMLAFISLAQTQEKAERLLVECVLAGVPRELLEELFPGELGELDPGDLAGLKLGWRMIPAAVRFHPALVGLTQSNNWAISAKKTASGKAILAGDPHLEVNRLPSIWYEAAWKVAGRYCLAATVPGIPGALFGRTPDLAWSATYAFMDQIDSWVEDCRDGQFRREAAGETRWEPFRVRRETIRRKRRPAQELVCYENDHGLLDGDPHQPGRYLATRWSGADAGGAALKAMFALPRAANVTEGADLLATIEPAFHWVLADRHGSVAYQMSGRLPRRGRGHGLTPLRGWAPGDDWQGWASPTDLPREINPERGFVSSANNDQSHLRPPGAARPINLSMPGYRAGRIATLLSGRSDWSVADTAAMQLELFSSHGEPFLRVLRPLLAARDYGEAGRVLAAWDGSYTLDSRGAVLFERVYAALVRRVFGARLGDEVIDHITGQTSMLVNYYGNFDRILLASASAWFGAATQAEIFADALAAALQVDGPTPGPMPTLGEVQQVRLNHLLLGGKFPAWVGLDVGPIALPGGRGSLFQVQRYITSRRSTTFAPGFRLVTDFAADAVHTALAGGPSDRPFTRWYKSGLAGWLAGRLKLVRP